MNLSILTIFLSIEVERFDKKKGKLIQQFGEGIQVLSKSNACGLYRKRERFLSFQILICISEVFVSFRDFIFLVQVEINKQYTPI